MLRLMAKIVTVQDWWSRVFYKRNVLIILRYLIWYEAYNHSNYFGSVAVKEFAPRIIWCEDYFISCRFGGENLYDATSITGQVVIVVSLWKIIWSKRDAKGNWNTKMQVLPICLQVKDCWIWRQLLYQVMWSQSYYWLYERI